jgi:hypothetical protein
MSNFLLDSMYFFSIFFWSECKGISNLGVGGLGKQAREICLKTLGEDNQFGKSLQGEVFQIRNTKSQKSDTYSPHARISGVGLLITPLSVLLPKSSIQLYSIVL